MLCYLADQRKVHSLHAQKVYPVSSILYFVISISFDRASPSGEEVVCRFT